MRGRGRAIAFAVLALLCAAVAAVSADSYGTSVAARYGELRPVLVASRDIARGEVIDPRDLGRRLELRRIPASFVPPDAVASIGDAAGRATAAAMPAGSYVLASQLELPRDRRREAHGAELADGLRPVQIAVTGAEALGATGGSPQGARVDVVVTTEPDVGEAGRTYVAAESVELLALTQSGGEDAAGNLSSGPTWTATLALGRSQALRLIQAENFARQVRLMPHVR